MENIASLVSVNPPSKTISEMSAIYGVSLRTLRFYESKGLLKPTRCGTYRLYTSKDEIRLKIIIKGRRLKFSLAEIEKLMLSAAERHPNPALLGPDPAATAFLTPAVLETQIKKLTEIRASATAAIAELKKRALELC